jgi:hypothetical protein
MSSGKQSRTYRCAAFKLATQAEGVISRVEGRACKMMNHRIVFRKIHRPRAGISGYNCNNVWIELLRVAGDTDGETKEIVSSVSASVEFMVVEVKIVPRCLMRM